MAEVSVVVTGASKDIGKGIPLGRLGHVADIGHTALFLASREAGSACPEISAPRDFSEALTRLPGRDAVASDIMAAFHVFADTMVCNG